jgi:hypothetical protein
MRAQWRSCPTMERHHFGMRFEIVSLARFPVAHRRFHDSTTVFGDIATSVYVHGGCASIRVT